MIIFGYTLKNVFMHVTVYLLFICLEQIVVALQEIRNCAKHLTNTNYQILYAYQLMIKNSLEVKSLV